MGGQTAVSKSVFTDPANPTAYISVDRAHSCTLSNFTRGINSIAKAADGIELDTYGTYISVDGARSCILSNFTRGINSIAKAADGIELDTHGTSTAVDYGTASDRPYDKQDIRMLGNMTREDAEQLLRAHSAVAGNYLLRTSKNSLVLSIETGKKVVHNKLHGDANAGTFTINGKQVVQALSIQELVHYYLQAPLEAAQHLGSALGSIVPPTDETYEANNLAGGTSAVESPGQLGGSNSSEERDSRYITGTQITTPPVV